MSLSVMESRRANLIWVQVLLKPTCICDELLVALGRASGYTVPESLTLQLGTFEPLIGEFIGVFFMLLLH